MVKIQLKLSTMRQESTVETEIKSLLLAGYTGRNQETVKKHIEELRKIGVAPPKKVPTVYSVSPELLTNEEEIAVRSKTTSGEIEYVLLLTEDQIYVTVGSDETDRDIEKIDVQKSKEACPKVIAKTVWLYDEIRDHWDDIAMRAVAHAGGRNIIYQETSFEALLEPDILMETLDARREGVAIFSGTIPLKQKMIYADEFEVEIYDLNMNRKISHRYKVRRVV